MARVNQSCTNVAPVRMSSGNHELKNMMAPVASMMMMEPTENAALSF